MNRTKINELKQSAEAAQTAYTAEQSRLVAYGMPSKDAIAWAVKNRFSALVSAETVIEAYAAHQRLMAKHAARRAVV